MIERSCCSLCGQVAGDRDLNEILPLVTEPWAVRPVLAELPRAVVMPSIGALVPGHVLVCPVQHARSFVSAPAAAQADLAELTDAAEERLADALGVPVHRFEHGSSRGGTQIACSVEHAHVHLIPAAVDIRVALAPLARWRPVGGSIYDLRRGVGAAEYLMYTAPTGERWAATDPAGFPSQLMRRVFGAALNVEEWNWRLDPAVERVVATAALFDVPIASHAAAQPC